MFSLGELGWHMGPWFLPTLGAVAVAAVFVTRAVFRWRRRRYGRVELRWDHRATLLFIALAVAHVAPPGLFYVTGVTLRLVFAAFCPWSPYALAQHLVFGILLAVTSAMPLGALLEPPVPPFRAAELGAEPHPLAVLQPLIVPSWLIITGLVGHVRLARALAQPMLDGPDVEGSEAG